MLCENCDVKLLPKGKFKRSFLHDEFDKIHLKNMKNEHKIELQEVNKTSNESPE
jgi:hypothetical protein